MNWSFALINHKLAEVFFEKKRGKIKLLGHAYVKNSTYTNSHEREMIKADTKKVRLTYRNKKYANIKLGRAKTS